MHQAQLPPPLVMPDSDPNPAARCAHCEAHVLHVPLLVRVEAFCHLYSLHSLPDSLGAFWLHAGALAVSLGWHTADWRVLCCCDLMSLFDWPRHYPMLHLGAACCRSCPSRP